MDAPPPYTEADAQRAHLVGFRDDASYSTHIDNNQISANFDAINFSFNIYFMILILLQMFTYIPLHQIYMQYI